jgi:hypothetical protein
MNENKRYTSAVARCAVAARTRGHAWGGVWYTVTERLHASLCERCGAIAWVTRSGVEKHWRMGGPALEQDCVEDYRLSAAGDRRTRP